MRNRIIRALLALVLALVLALGLAALPASAEVSAATPYSHRGEALPDFTVATIDGGSFTLSEALKEKDMVLINLWATWCPPCEMEFPFMEEAYELYQDKVAVVALSIEPEDTDAKLAEYAEAHGMTFPVGSASGTNLGPTFATLGIPTSLIVDRFGNIGYIEIGAQTATTSFTRAFDAFVGEDYAESIVMQTVYGSITANEGDVLAGDFADYAAEESESMTILLDDVPVRAFGGVLGWSNWALSLSEGYHTIGFETRSPRADEEQAWLDLVYAMSAEEFAAMLPEEATYTVSFADQNGDPVPGCVINFCTDETCEPVFSDENGVASYTGAPYAYHLQVIKVPEGYEFDTAQEFVADVLGGALSFTVNKR